MRIDHGQDSRTRSDDVLGYASSNQLYRQLPTLLLCRARLGLGASTSGNGPIDASANTPSLAAEDLDTGFYLRSLMSECPQPMEKFV
jgi:hypothetical protein